MLPGGGAYGGRRSGPGTPLLRWKFDNGDRQGEVAPEVGGKGRRKKSCDGAPAVSARRLAAGLWKLHLPEFASGGGEGRRGQVVSEVSLSDEFRFFRDLFALGFMLLF